MSKPSTFLITKSSKFKATKKVNYDKQVNQVESPIKKRFISRNTSGTFTQLISTPPQSMPLQIGEVYGGGVIFYINTTSSYSLIVDTSDIEVNDNTTRLYTASGSIIGTGEANTLAILAGTSTESDAARLAYNLVKNGYSDWYLPSINELQEAMIYSNSLNINTFYLSSTVDTHNVEGSPGYQQNYLYSGTYKILIKTSSNNSINILQGTPSSGQTQIENQVYMGHMYARAIRKINTIVK
jgi:hypothetical protein